MAITNISPRSALAVGANTNALRDIKPPIDIPSGWAWLFWVLLVLAVAALAFWAWRYWQKRRAQAKIVPVVPPHIRAKQKLREALALISQPREFCIAVSDTIRWYLEERFDFHAPERTTEEFLYELQGTNLLTPDQKDSLGEFLKRCDLVKFAKYEPGRPELEDLHASAVRLVEETEPIMATLEAVKVQGSADGVVTREPQIASGPVVPSVVVPTVAQAAVSKGKRLAVIGIVLQLAPYIAILAYLTVILNFIGHAFGAHDPAQETAAAESFVGHMLGVVILIAVCLLAALAGLVLLVIALTKLRYRAEWFFWFLIVYSVLILGAFPIGTAAAIFFFVYCLTRRQEFLKRGAAAANS
jgi:hypothetical protein